MEEKVYVLYCEPGYIKIGRSVNPRLRLGQARAGHCSHPEDAKLDTVTMWGAMPGGMELERELHKRFWRHRIGPSEWFYAPEITEEVKQLPLQEVIGASVILASGADLSAVRRAASLSRTIFSGGRPRSRKKRCPCGQMTAQRAKARRHKCTASQ